MTDESQAASSAAVPPIADAIDVKAEPAGATYPAVGDILPQGTVSGVRRFAAGGVEISINGSDWIVIA